MKVEKKEEKKEVKFPCLMECNGVIILALGEEDENGDRRLDGIVLHEGDSCFEIGDQKSTWESYIFKPFEGKLILSND